MLSVQNILFNHECEKSLETYSIQIVKIRKETQNQVEWIAFYAIFSIIHLFIHKNVVQLLCGKNFMRYGE